MSMFTQLVTMLDTMAPPKALAVSVTNPERKGHKLALKLEAVPATFDADDVELAAFEGGLTATETVPLATGAKEARKRNTFAGDNAVRYLRAVRGVKETEKEAPVNRIIAETNGKPVSA